MTDRDWFAAFAMLALMDRNTQLGWSSPEQLAGRAYAYGDAMLAEQRKHNREQLGCPEKTTTSK